MKILLFLVSCFLLGCDSKDMVGSIGLSEPEKNLGIVIRPNQILEDGRQLMSQQISNTQGDFLLRAFPASKYIQKINIRTGDVVNLTIPKEGPNSIGRLNGFVSVDGHKIVIFGNSKIVVINQFNEIETSINFTPDFMKKSSLENYYVRVNHQFYPRLWKDKIILHLEKANSSGTDFPVHYEGYVFAILDANNYSLQPLDISWEGLEKGYFGGLQKVHFNVLNDNLIYGFSYSPKLYSYNLAEQKKKAHENMPFLSITNSNYLGDKNPLEQIQHLYKSVMYNSLRSSGENYYQAVLTPPDQSDNRFGKGHLLGFRVFDKDFKLIAEGILPPKTLRESIVIDNEVYLRTMTDKEDVFNYEKLEIDRPF